MVEDDPEPAFVDEVDPVEDDKTELELKLELDTRAELGTERALALVTEEDVGAADPDVELEDALETVAASEVLEEDVEATGRPDGVIILELVEASEFVEASDSTGRPEGVIIGALELLEELWTLEDVSKLVEEPEDGPAEDLEASVAPAVAVV